MNICFIGDVEDSVHQLGAKRGVICVFLHFTVFAHLVHADGSLSDKPVGLTLHRLEHLPLFLTGKHSVEFLPLFILFFTELSIFNNDFFALIRPPCFIIELFLLI